MRRLPDAAASTVLAAAALAGLASSAAAAVEPRPPAVAITSPMLDDGLVTLVNGGDGYDSGGPHGSYELGDTHVRATITDDDGTVEAVKVSWTFCKELVGPACTPVAAAPPGIPLNDQSWHGERDLTRAERGCRWHAPSQSYTQQPCNAAWYPPSFPGNYVVRIVAIDETGSTSAQASRRFRRA